MICLPTSDLGPKYQRDRLGWRARRRETPGINGPTGSEGLLGGPWRRAARGDQLGDATQNQGAGSRRAGRHEVALDFLPPLRQCW